MLHETLKTIRKQKGYSQEEVAARLNVVRQTVSKWEKGLSVPDADMLVKLAELYELTVADLLGVPPTADSAAPSSDINREIAEQLSRINEQLVIRNRRARLIWRIIAGILISYVVLNLLLIMLALTMRVRFSEESFSGGSIVTSEENTALMQDASVIECE